MKQAKTKHKETFYSMAVQLESSDILNLMKFLLPSFIFQIFFYNFINLPPKNYLIPPFDGKHVQEP